MTIDAKDYVCLRETERVLLAEWKYISSSDFYIRFLIHVKSPWATQCLAFSDRLKTLQTWRPRNIPFPSYELRQDLLDTFVYLKEHRGAVITEDSLQDFFGWPRSFMEEFVQDLHQIPWSPSTVSPPPTHYSLDEMIDYHYRCRYTELVYESDHIACLFPRAHMDGMIRFFHVLFKTEDTVHGNVCMPMDSKKNIQVLHGKFTSHESYDPRDVHHFLRFLESDYGATYRHSSHLQDPWYRLFAEGQIHITP